MFATSKRIVDTLRDSSPQNISNYFWAAATLGYEPPVTDIVRPGVAHVKAIMDNPGFNPQAISNTVWALATMPNVWERLKGASSFPLS